MISKNLDKIYYHGWNELSTNPNAIHLIEKNLDKINWWRLSENPNAIHLLEKNLDKIEWNGLTPNLNANVMDNIHLLQIIPNMINWWGLSKNPNAICLLEKNPDKISWTCLSCNPSIFDYYDCEALKKRCLIYCEELMQKTMHPSRIQKLLDMGISIDELDDCI